jgi:hypothetical protein
MNTTMTREERVAALKREAKELGLEVIDPNDRKGPMLRSDAGGKLARLGPRNSPVWVTARKENT